MNTSYKIALVAAALLCALVIGYSVMFPGEGEPVVDDAGRVEVGTPPTERLADASPPRPLEMVPPREPDPTPAAPASPAAPADSNDLLTRALLASQAGQAPPSTPAEPDATPTPDGDAATTPPPASEPPVAAANQPGDIHDDANHAPDHTFTLGTTPPTIAPAPRAEPRTAIAPPVVIGPPGSTIAPAASSPPAATANSYTIKSGDTFTSIATALYGDAAKWVDIAQANPMVDPQKLKIGQVIRLPSDAELRAAAEPPPLPAGAGSTYIVREGDTLSTIAQRFYNNPNLWDLIHRANRETIGPNPDRIAAGDKLLIPPKP